MKPSLYVLVLAVFCSCNDTDPSMGDGRLTPVPFNEVKLNDSFWLPRLKIQKQTLVPFALENVQPAVNNLRKTANFLKGVPDRLPFPHRYVASDLYKVMEGAAYLLTVEPDTALERRMDEIIDLVADAQQEDGYHYESHVTGVSASQIDVMGDKPYSYVVHSHELYNMGHMYEGAAAYFLATGKDKWLKVAEKNARHIDRVFFRGDPNYNNGVPVNQAPGHEEIELALVKLHRLTGDTLYLGMAKRFLDIRGVTYRPAGEGVLAPDYAQQHLPVREQTKAVGHAVRATYLYAAMADVFALAGDLSLRPALDSIWNNIVDTRMHVTGGLGAVHGIEGFGPEYLLPNREAYNETCAAVGNVLFNHRLFLMTKDAKYMDVAEIALFNNVLAGVSLSGDRFFYVNPLEADGRTPFNHGRRGRAPWFGTACCPSNMARLVPQVPGLMYARTDDEVYCAFYAAGEVTVPLKGGDVKIRQRTAYPYDETVELILDSVSRRQPFTLRLRIPTWTSDERFVPGKLYRYTTARDGGGDSRDGGWELRLNGERQHAELRNGFVSLRRNWKPGDRITLRLPMPLRRVVADERVEADRDRLCFVRGPLVYCAESADNDFPVRQAFIDESGEGFRRRVSRDGTTWGIEFVALSAKLARGDGVTEDVTLTMLPYYAWNNRGDGAMTVWIPRTAAVAEKSVAVVNKMFESIDASHTNDGEDAAAIADNREPSDSFDESIPRWTSWARRGEKQSIEMKLKRAVDIESFSVYWYDDRGGVRVPESWALDRWTEEGWKPFPLYVTDSYSTFKDQYNMVHPGKPVRTDKLRLRMTPRRDAAIGILEVKVSETGVQP